MKNCDEIVYDLLERREEYMKLKKEKMKKSVIVFSSTLCALIAVFIIGFNFFGLGNATKEDADKNAAMDIVSNNQSNNQKVTDNQEAGDKTKEEEYAVYTDAITLPENTGDGVQYDMIGCLYYRGRVYTQAKCYYGKEVEKVKDLIGEKIGEAKGNIDEWSTQEDWSKELASTCSGSVHKVKGYSEDFRLFIYNETDEGEWLETLENYDHIGLNTGNDLFEERLHLAGNVTEVTYQTHKDWNTDWDGKEQEEKDSFKELEITEDEWNEFVEELCQSPFKAIDYNKEGDFYDTELQGHLYLKMKDGTEVGIRLIDGGYVGCSYMGWYFVKMPGGIFNKVMEACQK